MNPVYHMLKVIVGPTADLSLGSGSISVGTSVSLYRNHCVRHQESVLSALQVGERYLPLKTADMVGVIKYKRDGTGDEGSVLKEALGLLPPHRPT